MFNFLLVKSGAKTNETKISEAGQTFSSDSTALVLKDKTDKVNIEELPLFTFEALANATDQFHENNLLGRGGFGHVYKVRSNFPIFQHLLFVFLCSFQITSIEIGFLTEGKSGKRKRSRCEETFSCFRTRNERIHE